MDMINEFIAAAGLISAFIGLIPRPFWETGGHGGELSDEDILRLEKEEIDNIPFPSENEILIDEARKARRAHGGSLNILEAFQNEPTPLDFVFPGLLANTVGLIVAPGATGKSYWLLQAALSIATGTHTFGVVPSKTGEVVYISGEDPMSVVSNRLHAMGKLIPEGMRKQASENLLIEDIRGKMFDIINDKMRYQLIKFCRGVRLIIIDTLSRIHTKNENENGDMAQVISALEQVAVETGSSVLLAHHTSKAAHTEGFQKEQQSSRGASSLVDNARFTGYVAKMTEKQSGELSTQHHGKPIGADRRHFYVQYGIAKQNYGEPVSEIWMERKDGGVLTPANLFDSINNQKSGDGGKKNKAKGKQEVSDEEEYF